MRDHTARQFDLPIAEHLELPHTHQSREHPEVFGRRLHTIENVAAILIQYVPRDLLDIRRAMKMRLQEHVEATKAPIRATEGELHPYAHAHGLASQLSKPLKIPLIDLAHTVPHTPFAKHGNTRHHEVKKVRERYGRHIRSLIPPPHKPVQIHHRQPGMKKYLSRFPSQTKTVSHFKPFTIPELQ